MKRESKILLEEQKKKTIHHASLWPHVAVVSAKKTLLAITISSVHGP